MELRAGPKLASLAATVDETLAQLDIPKEEHAFNAHLTLARGGQGSGSPRRQKGDSPNRSFQRLQEKLAALPAPEFGTMTAREFFLYQSQLSPGGSKYTKTGGVCFAVAHRAGILHTLSTLLIIAAVSYLLGSIPFGYLLVRIFRGEDVRQSGSGNIGATNVSRKSPVLGVATLALDALKGTAAVAVSYKLADRMVAIPTYEQLALAALFAVIGHMFPVWLRFRGGKGVATGLGSFVVLAPKAVLLAVVVFIAVVVIFRYVSLGSIVAVAAFPFLAWMIGQFQAPPAGLAMMAIASLLIIIRHHENIRRLFAGTESRVGAKRA